MRAIGLGILAVGLGVPSVASAHDFWIEPATFRPTLGSVLNVALRVGEHFEGEPVKRSAEKMAEFTLHRGAETTPIGGAEGDDPAGAVKIERPGVQVIGYRSNHSSIELSAADFEAYLKEDGLEPIIAQRAKRGESDKSAKEIYSRCAKAVVAAGPAKEGAHDRVLGYTLEIVPLKNPYALQPGEELAVRLIFEGKFLPGAKIVAMNKTDAKNPLTATTADDGTARFKLTKPGMWMIKSVQMIPAPQDSGANWESFWATLTFEIQ